MSTINIKRTIFLLFDIYITIYDFSPISILLPISYITFYNDRTSYFYLNPSEFNYSNYSLFDFSCINEIKQRRKSIKDKRVMIMKKLPIIIVSVGCIITGLIVSMTPAVKVVNNTTYSYFNYELLGIGFAISLLLGIISLWFIKRKGN